MNKTKVSAVFITFTLLILFCQETAQSAEERNEIKAVCQSETPVGMASLCLVTSAVSLGPLDEVTNVQIIKGMQAVLLPKRNKEYSSWTLEEIREHSLATQFSNEEGRITFHVKPGRYTLCIIDKSMWRRGSGEVFNCTEVDLKTGQATKLVIEHTPRGDHLNIW